jgi:ribose 5-phosphate isomerase B
MIAIGSDHAGIEYKGMIKELLIQMNKEVHDVGPVTKESTDYPVWGHQVAQLVEDGVADMGILVCGTGVGMSMTANRHAKVRAAVCESSTTARLSRQHNDANILCLGERVTGWEKVVDIVTAFVSTPFDGGDRHIRRIKKIDSNTGN